MCTCTKTSSSPTASLLTKTLFSATSLRNGLSFVAMFSPKIPLHRRPETAVVENTVSLLRDFPDAYLLISKKTSSYHHGSDTNNDDSLRLATPRPGVNVRLVRQLAP